MDLKRFTTFAIIIIFVFGFLGMKNWKSALASSGACSSHGGVMCSAGADSDGSVICSDGWRDSSVTYSSVNECRASSGCVTENDYKALQVKLNAMGGYLGSSASSQGALNQCRAEINAHQSGVSNSQSYAPTSADTLLPGYPDINLFLKFNELCKSSYGNESYYDPAIKNCHTPKPVISTPTPSQDNLCKQQFGDNSISGTQPDKCSCKDGFAFGKSGQCAPEAQYCSERIGSDSFYNPKNQSCSCNIGYVLGASGICVQGDTYCSQKSGPGSWLNPLTLKCEWCEDNGVRGTKVNGQCVFPTKPKASIKPTTVKKEAIQPMETPKNTPELKVEAISTTTPAMASTTVIANPKINKMSFFQRVNKLLASIFKSN
ncbi:MAG: hypothetical protein WCV79_02315 [Candidatus Paceibacterota bacterium]|jgi:hypothetical protein